MSQNGDLHNFGRSVRAVTGASGVYFQKPRPVYWEWLFFGRGSPLVPFFEKRNSRGWSPGGCLFNLDVEMSLDFVGSSKQVQADSSAAIGLSHAYSLGVLLAYCYVFGIRDLHRHNLLATASHLQVVDAEAVLVRLLLPNETLLLPFKDVGPDLAAINHLSSEPASLSADVVSAILLGYCDAFGCIGRNLSGLQRVFVKEKLTMSRVPIRHIMRDTVVYRRWKTDVPVIPYCEEELAQLERGDIPYFFKFIGDPKLYCYTDNMGSFSQVPFPDDFRRAIARDATDPADLLNRDRIDQLLPTGLLFLAKQLWLPEFRGSMRNGEITLTQDSGMISAVIGDRRYQAARG